MKQVEIMKKYSLASPKPDRIFSKCRQNSSSVLGKIEKPPPGTAAGEGLSFGFDYLVLL